MTGEYSALQTPESGIVGSPIWPSAELSFDSGTPYPSTSNEKRAADAKARAGWLRLSLANLVGLPMALHVGVLAFYVALVVIWATGVEQNIEVALTSASRVQTWLNLISHLSMLGFSTSIIAVVQPIATRSAFGTLPQPLTSLSDKVASWNGLGSSLLNLYYNLRFPVTLDQAIITSLYFTTLTGLGISSSFLFNVPAVNQTIISNITTRVGSPSVRGLIPPESGILDIPPDFTDLSFDWYRSGVGVGMLSSDNKSVYPGLSANRIFDTALQPISDSSNSTATVGYTDFNVKCGGVPRATISATSISGQPDGFADLNFTKTSTSPGDWRYSTLLSIEYGLGPYSMILQDVMSISANYSAYAVSRLWQPADVLLRVPDSNIVPGLGRNLVMYNIYNETGFVSGSQPILDANHSMGSPWPLNVTGVTLSTSLMVQVIGCSLSTSTGTATIDVSTNGLLSTTSSLQGASANSLWADWKPDLNMSNALEDTWASMFLPKVGSIGLWDSQPVPSTEQWSCLSYQRGWDGYNNASTLWNTVDLQRVYETCHVPTVIEDYLTTRLFGAVTAHNKSGDATRDPSSANATLGALESSLASATAMAMWSAARASTLTVTSPQANLTSDVNEEMATGVFVLAPSTVLAPANGFSSVTERVLVGRVTFNTPLLTVGAILATILTALGMYVLGRGDAVHSGDAPINDVGLLNLMTLDNSAIAARLSASNMDSVNSRRRAGDFLVRIVDGRLVPVEDIV